MQSGAVCRFLSSFFFVGRREKTTFTSTLPYLLIFHVHCLVFRDLTGIVQLDCTFTYDCLLLKEYILIRRMSKRDRGEGRNCHITPLVRTFTLDLCFCVSVSLSLWRPCPCPLDRSIPSRHNHFSLCFFRHSFNMIIIIIFVENFV